MIRQKPPFRSGPPSLHQPRTPFQQRPLAPGGIAGSLGGVRSLGHLQQLLDQRYAPASLVTPPNTQLPISPTSNQFGNRQPLARNTTFGYAFPTKPAPANGDHFWNIGSNVEYIFYNGRWYPVSGAGSAPLVTSITETTTVSGDLVFATGGGVTQGGPGQKTFTFTAGATVLTANFTIPAVGATGSMSVLDGVAAILGSSIYIANNSGGVDQQGWEGQVVGGGGTSSLTVITTNLGTFSPGGTILSGAEVSWGETPTTTGPQPTVPSTGTGGFNGISTCAATLSGGAPSVGQRMVAYASCRSGSTLNPPAGWNVMDAPLTTAAGGSDVTMASWFRDVQVGDGATYTWSVTGTGLNLLIAVVNGGANSQMKNAAAYNGGVSEGPSTPIVLPNAPNSLALAVFCVRASVAEAPTTGWTQIAFSRIDTSGLGLIGMNSGPLTTTNAIQGTCATGDFYSIAAICIFPPVFTTTVAGVASLTSTSPQIVVSPSTGTPVISTPNPFVDTATAQAIGGAKTFSSPPTMSGANIATDTVPIGALSATSGVSGDVATWNPSGAVWAPAAAGVDELQQLIDVTTAGQEPGTPLYYLPQLTAPTLLQAAPNSTLGGLGTFTITLPNPTTVGTRLVFIVCGYDGGSGYPSITNTGFTAQTFADGGAYGNYYAWYVKTSTGADQTLTFSVSSGYTGRYGANFWYFEISGVGSIGAAVVSSGQTTGNITIPAGSLGMTMNMLLSGTAQWPTNYAGTSTYWTGGDVQFKTFAVGGSYNNYYSGSGGAGAGTNYNFIVYFAGLAGNIKYGFTDPQNGGPPFPLQMGTANSTAPGGGAVTATMPRAPTAGNELIAIVGWAASGTFTSMTSAGGGTWTLQKSYTNANHGVNIYTKSALAADTTVTATQSSATAPLWLVVFEIPSVNFLAIGVVTDGAIAGTGQLNIPITPTAVNSAIFGAYRSDGSAGNYAVPPGWFDTPIIQSAGCGYVTYREYGSNLGETGTGIMSSVQTYSDTTGHGMVGVVFEVSHA